MAKKNKKSKEAKAAEKAAKKLAVQDLVDAKERERSEMLGAAPPFVAVSRFEDLADHPEFLASFRGVAFEATVKEHGINVSVYYLREGGFHVCAAGQEVKEVRENFYWRTVLADQLDLVLREVNRDLVVEGVMTGPSIRNGRARGALSDRFRVYDVYDIVKGYHYSVAERTEFCARHHLDMVTVLEKEIRLFDVFPAFDALRDMVKGLAADDHAIAGLVFRPVHAQQVMPFQLAVERPPTAAELCASLSDPGALRMESDVKICVVRVLEVAQAPGRNRFLLRVEGAAGRCWYVLTIGSRFNPGSRALFMRADMTLPLEHPYAVRYPAEVQKRYLSKGGQNTIAFGLVTADRTVFVNNPGCLFPLPEGDSFSSCALGEELVDRFGSRTFQEAQAYCNVSRRAYLEAKRAEKKAARIAAWKAKHGDAPRTDADKREGAPLVSFLYKVLAGIDALRVLEQAEAAHEQVPRFWKTRNRLLSFYILKRRTVPAPETGRTLAVTQAALRREGPSEDRVRDFVLAVYRFAERRKWLQLKVSDVRAEKPPFDLDLIPLRYITRELYTGGK